LSHRKAAEPNRFNLPTGEQLRRALAAEFRRQRRYVLGLVEQGYKDQNFDDGDLGGAFERWLREGLLPFSERMTPIIALEWSRALAAFAPRVGLDPDEWKVTNPEIRRAIEQQVLDFCEATIQASGEDVRAVVDGVRRQLTAGVIDEGESTVELTKRLKQTFDGWETWRARRIAMTETSRAVHSAQELQALKSGVVLGWEWLLADDACPVCRQIADEARFTRLGGTFAVVGDHPVYSNVRFPPAHPHCVLPETPVWSPVWVAGIEAYYDGPIRRIDLSDGTRISVTANHMLLTADGFLPASALREGDKVVSYGLGDSVPLVGPDHDRKPPTALQVFQAIAEAYSVTASCMPVAAKHLHGDGRVCKGNVHVVRSDRFLRLESRTASFEEGAETKLLRPNVLNGVGFSRPGDLASVLERLRLATDDGVGTLRESKSISLAQLRHAEARDGGLAANLDPCFLQAAIDHRSRDAETLRDVVRMFPGKVTAGDVSVIKIVSDHYSGPVYDFETSTSLYVLGQGVVSSNCMCTVVEVLDIDTAPQWSAGPVIQPGKQPATEEVPT
jgi:hypothetical protein